MLPALAGFVELAFLKDMDKVWNIPGTSKNILRDSVEYAFSDIDVLSHTSVLLFHQPCTKLALRVEEYALSSSHRPWEFSYRPVQDVEMEMPNPSQIPRVWS